MSSSFWDEYYGEQPEAAPPLTKMYSQDFVDGLKAEIEHYKKLYRNELITSQALARKVRNGHRH